MDFCPKLVRTSHLTSAQHRFFDPKLVRTRHLTSDQCGFLSEAGSDKPFDEFVVLGIRHGLQGGNG